MANLNKVMLIGNAGKDAELRYMATGTPQCKFSRREQPPPQPDHERMGRPD